MVRPSQRREIAKRAMCERGACLRLECQALGISESCCLYKITEYAENTEVANWQLRLTDNHLNWGFGLCYSYFTVSGAFNRRRIQVRTADILTKHETLRRGTWTYHSAVDSLGVRFLHNSRPCHNHIIHLNLPFEFL